MSPGLKLYYLRTRVKKVTQTVMAKELGVRQATISNIEQGLSQPSLPLLRELCRYFDVTPTYLLDDEGPLEVGAADRWSSRRGLITTGLYLEVPVADVRQLDGSVLVAVRPGQAIFDEEAANARLRGGRGSLEETLRGEQARHRLQQKELQRALDAERQASRLRRRGHKESSRSEGQGES
jgi:DNA-binding XRE family transcriptional regulator